MRKGLLYTTLFLITFGLIFSTLFVKAQNEENPIGVKEEKRVEIKYESEKGRSKPQKLSEEESEEQEEFDELRKLDDFVKKEIGDFPKATFFFLNPSGHSVQQGFVEENKNNILTVNSQGFKVDWTVSTDTMVIIFPKLNSSTQTPSTINDIATGTKVKILGIWDGQKLIAKKVFVFALEKRVTIEVEKLINTLKELLQKAGINIDLTPLFQQLRK